MNFALNPHFASHFIPRRKSHVLKSAMQNVGNPTGQSPVVLRTDFAIAKSGLNKILVVNVNWLGDIIFSSPVFVNLRRVYPSARIVSLAVPRVREILESVPGLDEVIVYDEQGQHKGLGVLSLISRLRREKFDAVFYIHNSLTRAWIGFLSGIPVRVGYDVKGRGFLLTHKFADPGDEVHRSDRYLNVIEQFGVPVVDRSNVLSLNDADVQWVDRMLAGHGIVSSDFKVMVNLGGNWDLKQWPIENFARLVEWLSKDFHGKVIIPGAQKDLELVQKICKLTNVRPLILAGQTNLKQLIALMSRANLVISADSGPLHIANAVGADVIGIFGPTSSKNTCPKGRGRSFILRADVGCNARACYHLQCPDNICMRAVSVKDVCDAVSNFRS